MSNLDNWKGSKEFFNFNLLKIEKITSLSWEVFTLSFARKFNEIGKCKNATIVNYPLQVNALSKFSCLENNLLICTSCTIGVGVIVFLHLFLSFAFFFACNQLRFFLCIFSAFPFHIILTDLYKKAKEKSCRTLYFL